jgi:D-alanyl-D-alanine dipeptidase
MHCRLLVAAVTATRRHGPTVLVLLVCLLCGRAAAEPLPPNFVLRAVAPTILQDMRYAGPDNFTGGRIPGYDAPECVLQLAVAEALKRVQEDLEPQGLSLKVYDCYRPVQAVRAMAAWAASPKPDELTKRFFPRVSKRELFALGYIAERSNHSLGIAVDLTLVTVPHEPVAPFDSGALYGPCTGPVSTRAPDDSIDMGTGFDCFDPKSHTAAGGIPAESRRWRLSFVKLMTKHGFRNYAREWWHFDYVRAGAPEAFDFPISPP